MENLLNEALGFSGRMISASKSVLEDSYSGNLPLSILEKKRLKSNNSIPTVHASPSKISQKLSKAAKK